MANKEDSLNKEHHSVLPQNIKTVVVPSKSNPRDPHVVNLFVNGKAECAKCPGPAEFSESVPIPCCMFGHRSS